MRQTAVNEILHKESSSIQNNCCVTVIFPKDIFWFCKAAKQTVDSALFAQEDKTARN